MTKTTIAISWFGLPQYAARQLRTAISHLDAPYTIIGTKPSVPVRGVEEALGQPVVWIEHNSRPTWKDVGLIPPDLFVQSGWGFGCFQGLAEEVKKSNGVVIGLSDANWRGTLRQYVAGAVKFRVHLRNHFDAMIVPGKSGKRLMKHFGMPESSIYTGMYGADPQLFFGGERLAERPRRLLFVGQLIDRKNILRFANLFVRTQACANGWKLRICGGGELRPSLPVHPNVEYFDFVQPEQLCAHYRQSQFLVLPSYSEAWGLVVHEATSIGCALLLASTVGSVPDLADSTNSILFDPYRDSAINSAIDAATSRSSEWLNEAEGVSRKKASEFGPARFRDELLRAVADFFPDYRKKD